MFIDSTEQSGVLSVICVMGFTRKWTIATLSDVQGDSKNTKRETHFKMIHPSLSNLYRTFHVCLVFLFMIFFFPLYSLLERVNILQILSTCNCHSQLNSIASFSFCMTCYYFLSLVKSYSKVTFLKF